MKPRFGIEFKIIFSAAIFAIFIAQFQQYELSQKMIAQFEQSKAAKNRLLVETIAPVIGLNLAFGLEDANRIYLEQIVTQNSDIAALTLESSGGEALYRYTLPGVKADNRERTGFNYTEERITDSLSGMLLGTIRIYFLDDDYQQLIKEYRMVLIKIVIISLLALILFLLIVRRELRQLRELSEQVKAYDPKNNTITITPTQRRDEVGVIRNAISAMIERIAAYSTALDEANATLEAKVRMRTQALEAANVQLEKLSVTDALTDVPNRRFFHEHLSEQWKLAERHHVRLALIICDIDLFKNVNDTYGHLAGDMVLVEVARVLKHSLKRKSDVVARYGGEEFAILLYESDDEHARLLCESIQDAFKSLSEFRYENAQIPPVTMSFGVCSCIPAPQDTPQMLIKCADDALYEAKNSGRNQIVVSENGAVLSCRGDHGSG